MTLHRVVLWRHGETDYNAAGRIQGHLDSELSGAGRAQAARAAPAVAQLGPELAVSSDLQRAQVTAASFSEVSGVQPRLDKRLRETHLGEWQGLTGAEVEDGWPGAMSEWRADPAWAPPGGESRLEVAERAFEVVQELDQAHGESALLCAHGGLIIALTARMLDLPLHLWPSLGRVGNCHWVVLSRRPGGVDAWRLDRYNASVADEG
ncbi:histidine phosphatase family protein [Saccharopolyspora sp. HNM0983]|uniref:Histidine phosphatase family protein n=1 Tax=Saccharopolyspora montiporae TaxID=2781240 RepID=A0A929FZF7_9PSEU|nr:histidine phosphatase family protein [Saccharopolyspora sp. HNM0983]MBE9374525.1 histidine phosphatase family protein [Saccharopolyspora sp. HNM0983]